MSMSLSQQDSLTAGVECQSSMHFKMEIYGFLNSSFLTDDFAIKNPTGIISINDDFHIVSDFLCQDSIISRKQNIHKIYHSLRKSTEEINLCLKDLYIPSLYSVMEYRRILSRQAFVPTEKWVTKNLPSTCYLDNGEVMMRIPEGSILLYNRKGEIQSIGEDVLAICRYKDRRTGSIHYTIHPLNELTLFTCEDELIYGEV